MKLSIKHFRAEVLVEKKVTCPLCNGKGYIIIDDKEKNEFKEMFKKALKNLKDAHGLFAYPLPPQKVESV